MKETHLGICLISRLPLGHKIEPDKMSFENNQLIRLNNLRTHPRRVTRKDASMEGMVRPTILARHSGCNPFLNPQMHERRPNPLRFHRQMKFFQAAYHGGPFARYLWSKMDPYSGVVTRHPFFGLGKSASFRTST